MHECTCMDARDAVLLPGVFRQLVVQLGTTCAYLQTNGDIYIQSEIGSSLGLYPVPTRSPAIYGSVRSRNGLKEQCAAVCYIILCPDRYWNPEPSDRCTCVLTMRPPWADTLLSISPYIISVINCKQSLHCICTVL